MYLNLELNPRELAILKQGGFLSFIFDGMKVTITKNDILEKEEENDNE